MAPRKRNLDEFDPNKSDPDDSDFDVKAIRARSVKPSRSGPSKPSRKKRRTGYGSDSDIENDSSEVVDESSLESETAEESEQEVDANGRPRRRNRNATHYAESDEDSEEFMNKINEDNQSGKPSEKGTVLVFKVPNLGENLRRSNRRTSTGRRPSTSENVQPTRRSTRANFDEREPLEELSNSGRHVVVARPGTRSPEPVAPRPLKGGKGLKKPPSTIVEAENESSIMTKTEEGGYTEAILEPEVVGSADEIDHAQSAQDVSKEMDYEDLDAEMEEPTVVPESNEEAEEEDEDEDVLTKPRARRKLITVNSVQEEPAVGGMIRSSGRSLRSAAIRSRPARSSQRNRKGMDDTSDFEPLAEDGAEDDEGASSSSNDDDSARKDSQGNDDSDSNARQSRRGRRTRATSRRIGSTERESEVADELAEELEELKSGRRARRSARAAADLSNDDRPHRTRKAVDYRIIRPDMNLTVEDDAAAAATSSTPSKRARGGGGGWARPLFSTYGPFGGAGGLPPVLGGPGGIGAVGGVDSDSSDDDAAPKTRPSGIGGMVGMTPTSGPPPGFGAFPGAAQAHSGDALQASLGKVKDKQALVDADPLGVDVNINFDAVGGLQGHIDQLKEMVALPLLYPEVFQRFKVTPPRGVLFHGPPGTGKTLMARALANSVSSHGRKVTFYMRKGADALSKWVGEAERQLRLLFEEARKNQPSIIFFDEIDGLAPVRSNKQDQIHSSIVSTLLALMDGMDGRGQVIVVGATNRPDSVDPALRRPGRFDREFYFPLPGVDARRKILDIHTKNWDPPVPAELKDELAELTKGYGGADLRALCTEAALNAVQRRYPQIYASNEKLQINPATIKIAAKDFMVSIKKIVPSSERSTTSGAAPLPPSIEPLLRDELDRIQKLLSEILPQKKRLTALEEARFADAENEGNMHIERMQQEFERCRVFRPRLLLRGSPGMGQQYLAAALLNHFEGLHIQSFDLPTLLSDSTRSPESAVVQFFTEVKRHKPSVIYIPNVDVWYRTVGETVISTFQTLLRSLAPTDPVLLLGVLECSPGDIDPMMVKNLFGYSKRNQFEIDKSGRGGRNQYFEPLIEYLDMSPDHFPEPSDRKPRILEQLPVAPPPPPKKPEPLTKEQKKAQKKRDRQTINTLKIRIQPVMDQIKLKYRIFRNGVIDDKAIKYLFEEADPNIVTSDLEIIKAQFRPYEKALDKKGEPGLQELSSGKFFYNMNTVLMEERLVNGYYKRPKDFLSDVKKLTKDARAIEDMHKLNKASELQANVEVDMGNLDIEMPWFQAECEAVYQREKEREKEAYVKTRRQAEQTGRPVAPFISTVSPEQDEPVSGQQQNQVDAQVPVLTQSLANGIAKPFSTPMQDTRRSHSTNGISDLSNLNGDRSDSNGNSIPSRQEDIPTTNSDDSPSTRETLSSSFGPSAQARPLHFHTGAPSDLHQRQSYPHALSQRSAITPLAEGSNPAMYHNSASTTSSDKRNTGSTDLYNATNSSIHGRSDSDGTNIRMDPPRTSGKGEADMSMLLGGEPSNSQLPSTQGVSSGQGPANNPSQSDLQHLSQITIPSSTQSQSQISQPQPPTFPRDILNATARPSLVVDKRKSQAFLDHLVSATTACSVEQLEQIYSALMSEIWHSRGSWNRLQVTDDVRGVLDDLMADMVACQSFGPGSHDMEF